MRRRAVVAFVLGALAAIALANTTSRTEASVGPGRVELRLSAGSSGRTDLILPPLGRVTAPTHGLPVKVTAEVKELDVSLDEDGIKTYRAKLSVSFKYEGGD